jgi:hypothetical protein
VAQMMLKNCYVGSDAKSQRRIATAVKPLLFARIRKP